VLNYLFRHAIIYYGYSRDTSVTRVTNNYESNEQFHFFLDVTKLANRGEDNGKCVFHER
jgi:hypothetical protein